MDNNQIYTMFLFHFKQGQKETESACDTNDVFGSETTISKIPRRGREP